MPEVTLIKGDATEPWAPPDNSLDSIVTDPPYGIAFMGKEWDDKSRYQPKTTAGESALAACKLLSFEPWQAGFVAFTADWASQAHRCLKPGAFLLAFAGTKASDLLTMGLRAAGFEILDGIEWLYLSGFPKAQDIGKAFDKRENEETIRRLASDKIRILRERRGLTREDVAKMLGVGSNNVWDWEVGGHAPNKERWAAFKSSLGVSPDEEQAVERELIATVTKARSVGAAFAMPTMGADTEYKTWDVTAPATDLAKKWDGWKTPALKPAHEPIIVAQKPFSGTYCDNIERWGVGAINVDGCRVPLEGGKVPKGSGVRDSWRDLEGRTDRQDWNGGNVTPEAGRFPANVVMSHGPDCTPDACQPGCPVKALDEQSGSLSPGRFPGRQNVRPGYDSGFADALSPERNLEGGGASRIFPRFFYEEADFVPFRYQPKPSRTERNAGCDDLPKKPLLWSSGTENPGSFQSAGTEKAAKNNHPTVKPLGLIQWLQRLVTPPGGLTASPFLGSGTDAVAASREGFAFWGMEISPEYWPIIEARVAGEQKAPEPTEPPAVTPDEAPEQPGAQLLLAI